jgi:hypothetical protein
MRSRLHNPQHGHLCCSNFQHCTMRRSPRVPEEKSANN